MVGAVTPGALALSGVLIGLALIFLGATGLIDRIARLVPQSVLSGLQLGLGLALGWIALGVMQDQWIVAGVTLGVVAPAELAFSRRLVDALPSCRPVIAVAAIGTVAVGLLAGLAFGTGAEIRRKRWIARRSHSGR
jgi:hypothetical protein